jgi:serine/threonine-protein kinase SRPK3
MRELSKDPARMYGFSKTIPPDLIPFHPVVSAPLHCKLNAGKPGELHWVIADLGHGALARH